MHNNMRPAQVIVMLLITVSNTLYCCSINNYGNGNSNSSALGNACWTAGTIDNRGNSNPSIMHGN